MPSANRQDTKNILDERETTLPYPHHISQRLLSHCVIYFMNHIIDRVSSISYLPSTVALISVTINNYNYGLMIKSRTSTMGYK